MLLRITFLGLPPRGRLRRHRHRLFCRPDRLLCPAQPRRPHPFHARPRLRRLRCCTTGLGRASLAPSCLVDAGRLAASRPGAPAASSSSLARTRASIPVLSLASLLAHPRASILAPPIRVRLRCLPHQPRPHRLRRLHRAYCTVELRSRHPPAQYGPSFVGWQRPWIHQAWGQPDPSLLDPRPTLLPLSVAPPPSATWVLNKLSIRPAALEPPCALVASAPLVSFSRISLLCSRPLALPNQFGLHLAHFQPPLSVPTFGTLPHTTQASLPVAAQAHPGPDCPSPPPTLYRRGLHMVGHHPPCG
jgi:hypothetical protein